MNVNEQRLINEFLELVQVDSAPGEERQIADVLRAKLTKMGFSVTEDGAGQAIGGNAGNLIAKLPGSRTAPAVLFCAHMDRVSPGKNIKPRIEEGVFKSDGNTILAADDVAGLTAILEGIRTIEEQNIAHGEIEVLFTISEEGGLFGAKNLDPASIQARMAFFLDSGQPVGSIITQAPANTKIKAIFHGREAHAGNSPEKGISAIVVASNAVARMKLGRIDEETTANVGTFHAGTATNVVPEKAEITAEARSRNPQKLQAQVEHMVRVISDTAAEFNARADIEVRESYPVLHVSDSEPVAQLAVRATRKIGCEPRLTGTGGGSDANVISGYGIPSVVLGLGYQDVHSKNESMRVADLVKSAEWVVAIIEEVAAVGL